MMLIAPIWRTEGEQMAEGTSWRKRSFQICERIARGRFCTIGRCHGRRWSNFCASRIPASLRWKP